MLKTEPVSERLLEITDNLTVTSIAKTLIRVVIDVFADESNGTVTQKNVCPADVT